jgi:hypothetical protein
MKVKQILEIMKIMYETNLPYDMKLLDKQFYTSESQNKTYAIDDMDIIHFVRSFIKMQNILAEEVRRDTQEGRVISQTNQIFKLEKRVSELLEEREYLKKRIKYFYDSQIPRSVPTATFNYIPNNKEGEKLVDGMKQYLNKERYTLKDRGQCINREKYSLDEVSTDRGIDKKEYGKYLKVHINEKRRK